MINTELEVALTTARDRIADLETQLILARRVANEAGNAAIDATEDLRDRFAMAALSAFTEIGCEWYPFGDVAIDAYKMADCMLAEKAKRGAGK